MYPRYMPSNERQQQDVKTPDAGLTDVQGDMAPVRQLLEADQLMWPSQKMCMAWSADSDTHCDICCIFCIP